MSCWALRPLQFLESPLFCISTNPGYELHLLRRWYVFWTPRYHVWTMYTHGRDREALHFKMIQQKKKSEIAVLFQNPHGWQNRCQHDSGCLLRAVSSEQMCVSQDKMFYSASWPYFHVTLTELLGDEQAYSSPYLRSKPFVIYYLTTCQALVHVNFRLHPTFHVTCPIPLQLDIVLLGSIFNYSVLVEGLTGIFIEQKSWFLRRWSRL